MQTRPLKLAALVLTTLTLQACLTNSNPSPSEIKEAVEPVETVAARVKEEVCRGQAPEKIEAETYNSWPTSAQVYFTNRLSQYKRGCVD